MFFAAARGRLSRGFLLASALVLAMSYLLVTLTRSIPVQAAEVTSRSITMGTSEEDAETSYAIEFTIPAGSTVGAIRIEFCDGDPLAHTTCVFNGVGDDIPQVDDNAGAAAAEAGGGGAFTFSNATGGDCDNSTLTAPTDGDRYLEIVCTDVDTFGGLASTFTGTVTGIDNPSNATDSPNNPNNTFYARIYIYTDTTPPAIANPITSTEVAHTGGIAMSTAEQLTITARVQEILEFCVGTNATAPTSCAGVTGNAVDMGVLDFAQVNRATTQASPAQGSIMVRTNAANGVVVDYFAEQATTGTNHLGALRVTGSSCNVGDVETDQCIKSVGTTQDVIAAGVEEFGMCVFNIDYTGQDFGTATTGLDIDPNYDGLCDNSVGNGYAFDETGTIDTLATSTLTGGVVNDEMLEIDFAGTSAITTPTGLYTVTLTFIGTATF